MGALRGIVILFIVTKLVEAGSVKLTSGDLVGAGFSKDSQQIVPQRCYNATVSYISGQQGYIQLDTALSFSELENILGIDVSVGVSFGLFSADAEAKYTRSIQDKDYSLSLNYYQYATNNIAVQLAGYGETALSESGRGFYNGGKNTHFGLLCGDFYIASYQQGALLTMALNIKFGSSSEKREFEEHAGATFGDIIGATESVQNVVTKYKINGSIVIQAFQMGGEPSELAKVLNKDSSGQYYALACSLTAMDKCIKAASGLLDYAKEKFSSQFSIQNNTGLTPLGVAFTKYVPIEYIGLNPPPSLVTPEVARYRNELFTELKKNEYYQQKLYPFFNKGYPVELDADFLRNASLILSKANRNVNILMQKHGGGADCFNFPDKCKNIKAVIDSQLRNITTEDLRIFEPLRYAVTTRGGMFYNTGEESGKSWIGLPDNKPGKDNFNGLQNVSVEEKSYSYFTEVEDLKYALYYYFQYTGNLTKVTTNGTMIYTGTMKYKKTFYPDWLLFSDSYQESKIISPFFFVAYNTTNNVYKYHDKQREYSEIKKKLRFYNYKNII